MHENQEISSTPSLVEEGRSAKAINRNADMNVVEKSHCAVVPVNQPNKGANALAEVGEGRAQVPGAGRRAKSSKGKKAGTVLLNWIGPARIWSITRGDYGIFGVKARSQVFP
jgi:hypothetical protein